MDANLLTWIAASAGCGFLLLRHRRTQQFTRDRQVAGAFSRTLQRDPAPLLYDERQLPHSKRLIRAALLRLLVAPPNEEIRIALEDALEGLARYQRGVGETPLDPDAGVAAGNGAAESDTGARRAALLRSQSETRDVQRLIERARAVGVKRALLEASQEWSRATRRASQ